MYRISPVDMNFHELSAPLQKKEHLYGFWLFEWDPYKTGCWKSYSDVEAYIISSLCLQGPVDCLK